MEELNNIIEQCKMINEEMCSKVVCFTGHRSQKLPWKFDEQDIRFKLAKKETENAILEAIKNGKTHFINGMALGFDMMCAEIVLNFKKEYPNITLECALPFKAQPKFWPIEQQKRYYEIIKKADRITYISERFTETCLIDRNEYMVNNASLVIALFNGVSGGTKRTINYAREHNKQIKIIVPAVYEHEVEAKIKMLQNLPNAQN